MQDSGQDRAQRGQNSGITQNRAFLRFPGAAAPLQATKAATQRSRNSYAGFRPRQSPARLKPWYNAKSRVDLFAFSWRRGPAASNQGVAGTAMQDSGHDRVQRGQNTGITQNEDIFSHE